LILTLIQTKITTTNKKLVIPSVVIFSSTNTSQIIYHFWRSYVSTKQQLLAFAFEDCYKINLNEEEEEKNNKKVIYLASIFEN